MADFPVLIVGAGPVGLTLAMGLAQQGIRSLVLEKKAKLDEHSRALVVVARTLDILACYGLADRCRQEGYFLEQLFLHDVDRCEPVLQLRFDEIADETAYAGLLVLSQDRLERLLLEHVLASGLCDVRFSHELVSYEESSEKVTALFLDSGGVLTTTTVSFLLGCDGAHSTVRHLGGQPLEGRTFPVRVFLCDVKIMDSERDELPFPRLQLRPSGLVGALRYQPRHWRLLGTIAAPESEPQPVSLERIATLVSHLLGPGPFEAIWSGVFSVHQRLAPSFWKGRVLLVGDAAHISSPAGGQGMNSGMQDAHNLAWKLARVLAGGCRERLLRSYEQERRSVIASVVLPFTTSLTRVALQPRLVRTALRVVRWLLRSRRFRRVAGRRLAMLGTHYHNSPLISGEPKWAGHLVPGGREAGPTLFSFDAAVQTRRELEALTKRLPQEYNLPAIAIRHVEKTDPLWRRWQARPKLVALVRPDQYIAWAALNPTPAQTRSAILQALGQ